MLAEERSIECFRDLHIPAFALGVVTLLVFSVGFPLFVLYVLTHLRKVGRLDAHDAKARFGVLYERLRYSLFFLLVVCYVS